MYHNQSDTSKMIRQTLNKLIVGEKKCGDGICKGAERCETCLANCPCASTQPVKSPGRT